MVTGDLENHRLTKENLREIKEKSQIDNERRDNSIITKQNGGISAMEDTSVAAVGRAEKFSTSLGSALLYFGI